MKAALLVVLLALTTPQADTWVCNPPAWYVRVYFESPLQPGLVLSELRGFCSESEAREFRDDIDAHGLREYGVSYQWNSVSHSGIRGFAVVPNVW